MVSMLLVLLATSAMQCSFGADSRGGRSSARGSSRPLHLRGEALGTAQLQVGTAPGKANVVAGFDLVDAWESGGDLAAAVTPTQPAIDFYLRATGGDLQFTRATVDP